MAQILLNNVSTKLTAAISAGATSITVTAGTGALFAAATGADWIIATLVKQSGFKEIAWEVVKITARSTDTLTIVRAQEAVTGATTALSFSIGDTLDVRFTAGVDFSSIIPWASPGTIGSTTPNTGAFTTLTLTGNQTFSGTGRRIMADFSNATVTNRTSFQSSTTNGTTAIHLLPNGTSTSSNVTVESDPAVTTGAFFQFGMVGGTESRFTSGIRGAGTYTPITFYTTALERVRLDINGNWITKAGNADQSRSRQTPATGFSITIAANIKSLVLKPTGTLATGTITMPAAPIDGQEIRVSSSQIITALTVSANAGQTILNAPTTLAAGAGFEYVYDLATTEWMRLR